MQITAEIGISAAAWLPPGRDKLGEARGALAADTNPGYDELPVTNEHSGPELAVLAGRQALADTGITGADLALLVHTWSHYQGHDFWSPPHYVADQLGAVDAFPLGIQQMCNGGAAAIHTAVAYMQTDPAIEQALVTTGDRFARPAFSRWSSDYGVAYGDGGTAALLTHLTDNSPSLRLLSISSAAAPEFERMHRGEDPFAPAPRWYRPEIDARATKRAFLRNSTPGFYQERERAQIKQVILGALSQAKVASDDRHLVAVALPRLHQEVLDSTYIPLLAALTNAVPVGFGQRTGHLGAGDLIANIADLQMGSQLRTGEIALVLSAGAGFTWTCAVVARTG